MKITILGAGLVGSLLALYLKRKGFDIDIFEKRKDPRLFNTEKGRSINLALSDRGIKALEEIGLKNAMLQNAIPMYGRMIHNEDGSTNFQAYHHDGKCIYSISRADLNLLLLNAATQAGISIRFDEKCERVDLAHNTIISNLQTHNFDFLFGTDGAYSKLKEARKSETDFTTSEDILDYGYKELHIPPINGKPQLEQNALHIWPRKDFMLIALPNPDASFTCTLFLRHEGKHSFEALNTPEKVNTFFHEHFTDVTPMIETLEETFFHNPAGAMITVRSNPWTTHNTCLLGDAAHAIVPFYGQGMNAGFEGVQLLSELLEDSTASLADICTKFASSRKRDTDAIANLALANFLEMRDLVSEEDFLLRKKIERILLDTFPNEYQTLYSLVTFSSMPYSEAWSIGQKQNELFKKLLSHEEIRTNYQSEVSRNLIEEIYKAYLK